MSADASALVARLENWAVQVFATAVAGTVERMRLFAPVGPTTEDRVGGELQGSITATASVFTGSSVIADILAPVPQAVWTDEGTQPHLIPGNPYLAWDGPDGLVIRRFRPGEGVNHPGNAPQNWWQPNLEQIWPDELASAAASTSF